jgi:hypothetical protein
VTDRPSQGPDSRTAGLTTVLGRLADPILLILVGCAGIWDGLRILMTKQDVVGGVQAGGWIAALGALLVIGCCIHIAKDIGRSPADAPEHSESLLKPPAIAFVLLIGYVALLDPLGYVLSTMLFMAIYLRLFGRYGLPIVAAIAVPFAVGSGWLWAAMNMMLPQGPLPWP